ncbi:MAG: polyprenyl synthetase family protein [Propionibacteriaceae bacterium]|jgi:heptaprenyl diphosphate synthase|nr:polyprenyl synthetase family protein [Propionibacteriaceae bacterium]
MHPKLGRGVKALLQAVEAGLLAQAEANTEFISQAARHLIAAGGKRFRPTLVILASQLGGREADADAVVKACLVVELTHVASLYHDDVMDEAEVRRSVPSANARYGNLRAILVGDYLFARASAIVAELGVEYVALQARTFQRLVQGQINETLQPAGLAQTSLESYLQVIADKTGSLISTSAVFGGMVAGLGPDQLAALAAFGEEIGMVFQLSDDILDIESDESGKTPGTDLKAGVPTLPTLLALTDGAGRLQDLLAKPGLTDAEVAEAVTLLRAHPALAQAKAEVERRAAIARAHLDCFPDSPAKRTLQSLTTDLINRSS